MDITGFITLRAESQKDNRSASLFAGCPCHQTSKRVYYGNAEPEGKAVVLGGAEVVVGGWAAYEAARREARWVANPRDQTTQPRSWYGGRTYVSGQDAVESLVTARCFSERGVLNGGSGPSLNQADPLARSAERLAAAITAFNRAVVTGATVWARLKVPPDLPVAVSTLTPEDVRYSAWDTDIHLLHRAAEDAGILASSYARNDEISQLRAPRPPGTLPPMPTREVPLWGRDAEVNRSIVNLEKASVLRAAAIEAYRGEVAAVFDAAAAVLERAAKGGA